MKVNITKVRAHVAVHLELSGSVLARGDQPRALRRHHLPQWAPYGAGRLPAGGQRLSQCLG